MLTPCIGVCTLGPNGLCDGCLRSGDEIARWTAMGDAARSHLMDVVLPERERQCAAQCSNAPAGANVSA